MENKTHFMPVKEINKLTTSGEYEQFEELEDSKGLSDER